MEHPVRDREAARCIDRATAAQRRALALLREIPDPARSLAEPGPGQDSLERAQRHLLAARMDLLRVRATDPRPLLVEVLGRHVARLDAMLDRIEQLAGYAADGRGNGAERPAAARAPGGDAV